MPRSAGPSETPRPQMPYSQVDPLTPVAKTITLAADGAQHSFPDDGDYCFGFPDLAWNSLGAMRSAWLGCVEPNVCRL